MRGLQILEGKVHFHEGWEFRLQQMKQNQTTGSLPQTKTVSLALHQLLSSTMSVIV